MEARRPASHLLGVPVRVLIVDDHAGVRSAARDLLTMRGYTVVGEAASRVDALEAAVRLRPDAVLLEVRLRDDNGFDVARALKQVRLDAAVLLVSETDYTYCDNLLLPAGARGFISKSQLARADLAAFWPDDPPATV
jgi:DNA-binding NarL/FixJ family response regulator